MFDGSIARIPDRKMDTVCVPQTSMIALRPVRLQVWAI
jgi:hypothetical protein